MPRETTVSALQWCVPLVDFITDDAARSDPDRSDALRAAKFAEPSSTKGPPLPHGADADPIRRRITAVKHDVPVATTGDYRLGPPDQRRCLTPAGRRLADHAVTILAAVDAARLDLDPDAEPVGTVRVGGFATGIRVSLLPIVRELAVTHPRVKVAISEYEPLEAFDLLVDDDLDLAITYDYNLAPASPDPVLETIPLWSTPWGLGVRSATATSNIVNVSEFAHSTWIVNSRNTADEDAVRTLGALAGFTPQIVHQIDSLDLVEDLILDGHGVGLLPINRPLRAGLTILTLSDPSVILTAYAVTRRGRSNWSPLRTITPSKPISAPTGLATSNRAPKCA
jgi:DNA-binding transcriptional LysR family regulator